MSKVNLTSVTNIDGNPASAATNINANFATLQAQIDLLLSRDGESPNTMEVDLDMNSHNIINVGSITQSASVPQFVGADTPSGTGLLAQASDTLPDPIVGPGWPGSWVRGSTFDNSITPYGGYNAFEGTNGSQTRFPIATTALRGNLIGWKTYFSTGQGIADGANENGTTQSSSSVGQFRIASGKLTDPSVQICFCRLTIPLTDQGARVPKAAGRNFWGFAPGNPSDLLQRSSTAVSNMVNCVGLAKDDADTQLYIIHNDNAGAVTKIATGLITANILDHMIDMYITFFRATGNIYFSVRDREVGGVSFSQTLTTNLPTQNTDIGFVMSVGGGYTNAAVHLGAINHVQLITLF